MLMEQKENLWKLFHQPGHAKSSKVSIPSLEEIFEKLWRGGR